MARSKLIKKVDNQIYFQIFVSVLWGKEILLEYIRGFLLKVPVLSAAANLFIPAVMILLFLLSFGTVAERLRGSDFVFGIACLAVYFLEYYLFKSNRYYFEKYIWNFLLGGLPFYFVGVALRADREEKILQWLYRISVVSIIAFVIYTFFIHEMSDKTLRTGDMNSAYNLLPHVCLVFYQLMKRSGWEKLLLFVLGTLSLLMLGTRGAVLCLLVFVVVVMGVTIRIQKPLVLLGLVFVTLLLLFFGQIFDSIVAGIYSLAERLGMSTRTLDKFLAGEFAVSDARILIQEYVRYYLRQSPIIGLGIYGDCRVSAGHYAHNLFVEVCGHFGYIVGSVLLTAVTVLVYRAVRYVISSGDGNAQMISMLLFGCCFKLFVSSSYLQEPFFWLMIGYFVALIREKRETEQKVRTETRGKLLMNVRNRV